MKDKKTGEAKPDKFMIDVLNPKSLGITKAFLTPKVIAHAMTGDSKATLEASDIKGKYISATYHKVGDTLIDDSEVTSEDTIIDNSSVSFISKSDAIEVLSFQ